MKITPLLLLLSICFSAHSQMNYQPSNETGVAVGLSGGVSSKSSVTGNFSIGAMVKGLNHISGNLQVFSNPSVVNVPVIGEARAGHVFGTVEIYGGCGYHYAGNNTGNKPGVNEYKNGFKPAYGVLKHFYQSVWTVGAGMSGNIFSIQLGMFAVR